MTFWRGVLWLHVIAMAFFVGGQLMLVAVVVPVLRGGPDDQSAQGGAADLLRAAARRFGIGTVASVAVLIVTGAGLAAHYHRWGSAALEAKLGLVGVLAALIGAHMRWPRLHALDAAIFLTSLAIVWLGLVVAG